MKATIDRIEDRLAVILIGDDGSIKLNVPLVLLPKGAKEGDILDISIKMDERETAEAKERVTSLIDKLKSKNK